ncbi:MAG: hypothetical protein HOH01_02985 [Candidatus Jacksonbacteria bacterium]|nr:hypothetical protein [Candidatus Jacksonbacteria bacterium]
MATPTLRRSKSVETKAPPALKTKETKAPPALRGSSDPTTQDEIDEILDLQHICFKGGEQITFILTHRSWLTHGIHLGIKVVQDGKEFTLGFSPSVSKYLPMPGLFKPVEAAIFIPDIQVETALKTGTATEIKRSDGEPFLLSEEAATRLNEYTCNGTPGVKETFEMARLNPGDRAEWEEKFLFTKKFVPKNLKYRFVSNADECTNCQGFLSTIFANDPDVIKTIMPFLHEWGSKAVAQHKQALRAQHKQALRAPRSSFFDHFNQAFPHLGLGGNKKSRKTRIIKRRRKTRRKRQKRGGSTGGGKKRRKKTRRKRRRTKRR